MKDNFFAVGIGIGTKNSRGRWLEVFFPEPLLHPNESIQAVINERFENITAPLTIDLSERITEELLVTFDKYRCRSEVELLGTIKHNKQPGVLVIMPKDDSPTSVPEVYLKLQLLSHRLVKPHEVNLSGIFGILPNVAWTNQGAIDISELSSRQLAARLKGEVLNIESVDKFPKMTNYVVPSGVRIADTARVRLGAYLGEGTTIMHEGFVNFNAGTLGTSMVEGRISAGVIVGEKSDLGGGCSTMGTLSGGNNVIISVGRECLIGANAGVGIPLGDRCTIEAGLYLTAGAKLMLYDKNNAPIKLVKARELAGMSDLLFRRNSQTGALEALSNKVAIKLNKALHINN